MESCRGSVDIREYRCAFHVAETTPVAKMSLESASADIVNLITPYLSASDMLALRCTVQVMLSKLKEITDAIFDACRLIEDVTLRRNLALGPGCDSIQRLATIRLDVRCEMLKQFAMLAGMARYEDCLQIGTHAAERPLELKHSYFINACSDSGPEHVHSVDVWRDTIDITKQALIDRTYDVSGSVALANLYVAELYAPLIGVVRDPIAHIQAVMEDAAKRLSLQRWIDFLHGARLINEVHEDIHRAYQVVAPDFGATRRMRSTGALPPVLNERIGVCAPSRTGWVGGLKMEMSAEYVEILCAGALDTNTPQDAISALETAVRWNALRIFEGILQNPKTAESSPYSVSASLPEPYSLLPPIAWTIFDRCTVAQRLPLVAALFRGRNLLRQGGEAQPDDLRIAEDVVSFLCDPTSFLISPSPAVVDALLYHLPVCGERLPEKFLDKDGWQEPFVERFDLPPDSIRNVTE